MSSTTADYLFFDFFFYPLSLLIFCFLLCILLLDLSQRINSCRGALYGVLPFFQLQVAGGDV